MTLLPHIDPNRADAMTRTIPVTFRNRAGHKLFGMLHQPETPRDPSVAILLLSPGIKARVAPHRLYRKMADEFAALGFAVLRFDFFGLGDSEGELQESLTADVYGAIQAGRYIDDTVAAMDWMQENCGTMRFIASGLCGGALTGLLAAARDPRIVGLVALAIPVILDGSQIDFSRYMTDAQLKGTGRGYLRKLRLWDIDVWRSWARFFTFRSHYSLIIRSTLKVFRGHLRPTDPPGETRGQVQQQSAELDNTNPYFAPAFHQMVSTGRRILLVFAEADRLTHEFEAKFAQRHAASLGEHAAWYEIHVTQRANHIFSWAEWQRDMLDHCCRWLEREVPRRIETPASTVTLVSRVSDAAPK